MQDITFVVSQLPVQSTRPRDKNVKAQLTFHGQRRYLLATRHHFDLPETQRRHDINAKDRCEYLYAGP